MRNRKNVKKAQGTREGHEGHLLASEEKNWREVR